MPTRRSRKQFPSMWPWVMWLGIGILLVGFLVWIFAARSRAADWPSTTGTTAKGMVLEDGAGNKASPVIQGGAPSATTDSSGTITTGGTFATLLASNTARKSLEFTNVCNIAANCTTTANYCYITTVASGSATKGNSIPIPPGASYLRSSGAIPSDAIAGTCDGTGDKYRLASQ
jgi:hypothetical protein